jgi:peptidoglycan/LPS O-acetylase OafA/YrhL
MLGPDTFIALSGFLLCRTLASREKSFTSILGTRITRIFPLYLIVLAAYVTFSVFIQRDTYVPAEPGAAMLYVLENALLIPLAFGVPPMISAAWAIGVLITLYLGFSAAARIARAAAWTPARRAVTYAVIAGTLVLAPPTLFTVCAALFVAGAAARELLDVLPGSRRIALALLVVSAVALTIRTHDALSPSVRLITRIAAVTPLLICIVGYGVPLLENRILGAFGRMSYSYYLIHSAVLVTAKAKLFPVAALLIPAWALVPGMLAVTFVLSVIAAGVLYTWVELPLRRRPRYSESPGHAHAAQSVAAGQHVQSARARA